MKRYFLPWVVMLAMISCGSADDNAGKAPVPVSDQVRDDYMKACIPAVRDAVDAGDLPSTIVPESECEKRWQRIKQRSG